jgi:CPA1 family monovalent cation:H+ antiporter
MPLLADELTASGDAGAIELVFLLLVLATALAVAARRLGIPYPILLVLGGLLVGLVPGLPPVQLAPDVVFLLFLPPILFGAGYFTSIRDFKANLRAITLLAVGLVAATTVVVAVVAHQLVPGLDWAPAFALGAIVAPPDAIAATAVFQRLGVPRRVVTILEGESLVNDATALVIYRAAVLVTVGGTFSALGVAGQFVVAAAGGLLVGLVLGSLAGRVMTRLADPVFSVVISFLAPVAVYVVAQQLGVSGVIATVAAGILTGRRAAREMTSEVRIAGAAAWQVLLFLINGLAFILIGLQLRTIVTSLTGRSVVELLGLAVAISLTVVITRIVWVFPGTYIPRALSARIREREMYPQPRYVFIVAWAGMRGVVSMAAALALPLSFPQRDLLIFLTFAVVVATLVGQGLSLPLVIRALRITADEHGQLHEEAHVRIAASEAAVARIEELAKEWPDHQPLLETLRSQYQHRSQHLDELHQEGPETDAEKEIYEHRLIRRAVIDAERETIIRLRDTGAVSDEAFRAVERDLDLEELRMEA